MEQQAAGLVGRESERAVLHQLLGDGGPFVIFLHGIAGVGKSTLAEAFAVEARSLGATVLRHSRPPPGASCQLPRTRLPGWGPWATE